MYLQLSMSTFNAVLVGFVVVVCIYSIFIYIYRRVCDNNNNNDDVIFRRTRDTSYNSEEGSLRMYLRGRPICLYAPSDIMDSYDISKVATAPQSRLKLEWVYPFLYFFLFFLLVIFLRV